MERTPFCSPPTHLGEQDMSLLNHRSLKARDAGVFLAELLGLSVPISEQTMWRLARQKEVPYKRLAGQVLFRTDWLERFVSEDDSGLLRRASNSDSREDTKDDQPGEETGGVTQGPARKRSAP